MPKVKNTSSCDNFRPISVLPCLSKVSEKNANICFRTLASLVKSNMLIRSIPESCVTALHSLTDVWKWAIDNKQVKIAVFLDLTKAFDIINHKIILSRL